MSTPTQAPWLAIAALLSATSAWGGLFHAGKYALSALDPFWFTALRYTGATALLVAVCAMRDGVRWGLVRRHYLTLFFHGMLGYAMFGILVFVGLARSLPSHGAVIMATMPLTSLFIRWVFDRQPPRWWAWVGGWTALMGVGLVSGAWSSGNSLHQNTLLGDAIAWVGTLGWILYTRGQKKLPDLNAVEYTAYTAIAALPGVCAAAIAATWLGWAHTPSVSSVISVAPALAYIIAIGTVLAALLFNFGVQRLGATNGIVAINFVPIAALIISTAMGHVPTAAELLGTALVVVALLLLAFQLSHFSQSTPSLQSGRVAKATAAK